MAQLVQGKRNRGTATDNGLDSSTNANAAREKYSLKQENAFINA